jgi:transposase
MLELTDHAFTGVQRLLPANSRRGKPWRDHRQVLGGILWKLHTGRPWRDVPERFGPWQTCTAGCGAGRLMGPGRGSGRCWPPESNAQATAAAARLARRCWRRRQWQRRARA